MVATKTFTAGRRSVLVAMEDSGYSRQLIDNANEKDNTMNEMRSAAGSAGGLLPVQSAVNHFAERPMQVEHSSQQG